MKWRKRKKSYDCSHHVFEDFLVTDDPYPIHNTEDYCKLGKYDNTWLAPEKKLSLCDNCKKYCASIPMIRKQRERKLFLRECIKYNQKAYRAAVLAGISQDEDGFLNLDLVL